MKGILRSVLRHALTTPDGGAFVPAAAAKDPALQCEALLDAARGRLREAHAFRDTAARNLREHEANLRKALAVVDDSAAADRASDEAERTARAASQAWTAAGCPDDRKPDRDLLDRASAAHAAAIDARVLADGARDAIPGLEFAVNSARSALESAESRLREAVRGVLVAKAESHFAAMARAAQAFDGARAGVEGLAKMMAGNRHEFSSSGLTAELLRRLYRSMPQPPRREVKELLYDAPDLDAESWLAVAKRLLGDPEATL